MQRMLSLIFVLVFGGLGAMAEPWAETKGSEFARRSPEAVTEHSLQRKNFTLLPQILEGTPVRIHIQEFKEQDKKTYQEDFQDMVQQAYNEWFKNAVDWIEYRTRTKEFSDILPRLKQGISVAFVSEEFAAQGGAAPLDIELVFVDKLDALRAQCGCAECYGCRVPGRGDGTTKIVVQEGDYRSLVHEAGHTLGLADSYEEGYCRNASQCYRSKERRESSVMGSHGDFLTEDDADGIINLIDAWTVDRLQKIHPQDWQKYVRARVLNGWDSLTRDAKGNPVDRYRMGTSTALLLEP